MGERRKSKSSTAGKANNSNYLLTRKGEECICRKCKKKEDQRGKGLHIGDETNNTRHHREKKGACVCNLPRRGVSYWEKKRRDREHCNEKVKKRKLTRPRNKRGKRRVGRQGKKHFFSQKKATELQEKKRKKGGRTPAFPKREEKRSQRRKGSPK